MRRKIGIIGAGPGGMATAMLLQSKGFDVTVLESANRIGGRNKAIQVGHTKFDVGPTILVMKFVLEQCFKDVNRDVHDYLKFHRLHPMYRLQFGPQKHIDVYDESEKEKMISELKRVMPDDVDNYSKYIEFERARNARVLPLIQQPFLNYTSVFSLDGIIALPVLTLATTLTGLMNKYFKNPLSKISFSFQSMYLGMNAWSTPAIFGILPYAEHAFGCYHVIGGLSEIPIAMEKVFKENGGTVRVGTPVKQLLLNGKQVTGVLTESGEELLFDEVVLNADFGYAVQKLIPNAEQILSNWKPSKIAKKEYSCSTFMYYVALDKYFPELEHHTISFADHYKESLDQMSGKSPVSSNPEDITIYIRNASMNDPTLSPQGKSGLYIMAFVPNMANEKREWNEELIDHMKKVSLEHIATRCGVDIRGHIEAEKIFTPQMWRDDMNVHAGAIFSLTHIITQMIFWRPKNKFDELDNMYIVGGSTMPGSGLPVIWESGRIASKLICDKYGVKYDKVRF